VQILLCAANLKLGVDHAAQADAEGGQAIGKQLGIGDQGEVGLELGGLGSDKGRNSLSANFLFAFENDADVEGQLAIVGGKERLKSLDVGIDLALVVTAATGVEIAVALGGLKGRAEPLVQRIDRLDIVVAVTEHGGLAGSAEPLGIDQGVALGLKQAHFRHANAFEFRGQELGGTAAVALMLWQRGDGGDAQESLQFIEKACVILTGVGNSR
jgi:hypothetical protein